MATMGTAVMGEHLRVREATERANMSMEAVKQMAPAVNQQALMINALSQLVYELVNRLAAVEIVLTRYLDNNSVFTFSELLNMHIAEEQAKEAQKSDENTDFSISASSPSNESPPDE